MITVVPPVIPVTRPEKVSIVATGGVLLDHVPPFTVFDKVVVVPAHSCRIPLIGAGSGSTVITVVVIQVNGEVYVTVAVPVTPLVINPVLGPIVVAVATLAGVHDQVPPEVASFKTIVAPPGHNVSVPVIATGNGLTVTVCMAGVPQPLL